MEISEQIMEGFQVQGCGSRTLSVLLRWVLHGESLCACVRVCVSWEARMEERGHLKSFGDPPCSWFNVFLIPTSDLSDFVSHRGNAKMTNPALRAKTTAHVSVSLSLK